MQTVYQERLDTFLSTGESSSSCDLATAAREVILDEEDKLSSDEQLFLSEKFKEDTMIRERAKCEDDETSDRDNEEADEDGVEEEEDDEEVSGVLF